MPSLYLLLEYLGWVLLAFCFSGVAGWFFSEAMEAMLGSLDDR